MPRLASEFLLVPFLGQATTQLLWDKWTWAFVFLALVAATFLGIWWRLSPWRTRLVSLGIGLLFLLADGASSRWEWALALRDVCAAAVWAHVFLRGLRRGAFAIYYALVSLLGLYALALQQVKRFGLF